MDNKEAVKRLLLLLGRYKKTIVVIVGCLLVSTGLNLCVPLISRRIMDDGFIGGNKKLLIELVLVSMVIYTINSLIDIVKEKKRVDISAKIQYFLSEQSFSHLMKLRVNYFNNTNYAETLNNRASDYRIIVGDKNDTELMMSGIENTVLLDQYYESKVNLQNNSYVPNVGEYWYKYKRNSTSVITILSSATDIRFKILNVDTLAVMYDSAKDDDTHKTSFTGSGGWCCAEKARLTTVVGTEYYLVVYCTNPTEGVSLRTGSIATAVGNPVMCAASTKIIPGTSVTATGSGYSSTRTFSVSGDDIPNTAQVRTISLSGTGMSKIKRWRLMAPNKSVWVANESDFYPSINFNFVNDSSSNAKLKGTWSVAFQSSSSSYTFIPSYSVSYYYEYGD